MFPILAYTCPTACRFHLIWSNISALTTADTVSHKGNNCLGIFWLDESIVSRFIWCFYRSWDALGCWQLDNAHSTFQQAVVVWCQQDWVWCIILILLRYPSGWNYSKTRIVDGMFRIGLVGVVVWNQKSWNLLKPSLVWTKTKSNTVNGKESHSVVGRQIPAIYKSWFWFYEL